MNIRKELEALRDDHQSAHDGIIAHLIDAQTMQARVLRGIADREREFARELDALLQRLPDGWELRPREPSEEVIQAAVDEGGRAAMEGRGMDPKVWWRAMWDAASEEAGHD